MTTGGVPLINTAPKTLFNVNTPDGVKDVQKMSDINDITPGKPKKFKLHYEVVDTREVTVVARTIEEAWHKATLESARRIRTHFTSGLRHGEDFQLSNLEVLQEDAKGFGRMKSGNYPRTDNGYVDHQDRIMGFATIRKPIDTNQQSV